VRTNGCGAVFRRAADAEDNQEVKFQMKKVVLFAVGFVSAVTSVAVSLDLGTVGDFSAIGPTLSPFCRIDSGRVTGRRSGGEGAAGHGGEAHVKDESHGTTTPDRIRAEAMRIILKHHKQFQSKAIQ